MLKKKSSKIENWNLVTTVHLSKLQCEVNFNNDRNLTYSCVYTPTMEGEYRVIVKFAGKEIPKSPYKVNVDAMPGNYFSVLFLCIVSKDMYVVHTITFISLWMEKLEIMFKKSDLYFNVL